MSLTRVGLVGVLAGLGLGVLPMGGCMSAEIALKEQLGFAKRDQLVARVDDARDSQEEAKAQFESALDEFLAITGGEQSDLEKAYRQLKKQLDRSEDRASSVRADIAEVETVASKLFREWEDELDDYASEDLRASSAAQLSQTRARYAELIGAMRAAEAKMDPVLTAFNDQVLFLKHNLNAQAIASLEQNVSVLEGDIAELIAEMNASIAQAEAFIDSLERGN